MHIDVGDDRDLESDEARARRARKAIGMAVTFILGPAAMAFALIGLGMGPVEAAAVLILLSGWIGPRLIWRNA